MRDILRSCFVVLLAGLFALLSFGGVQAAAVQPLVFDIEANPGAKIPFEILVSAEEDQEIVVVNFASIIQDVDSSLQFILQEEWDNPVFSWINLETNQLIIPPGKQQAVRGEVNVPFDAAGTHVLALMIEPQTIIATEQVSIRIIYAVRLVIDVQRPGLRPEISVESIRVELDEDGSPFVRAVVHNTSNLLYPLGAEMTIRDENRALVERLVFGLEDYELGVTPTIDIYPGSELWLDAPITKPLFPGTYEMRLFLRYADGRQKVHTEQLVVEEGDFLYDLENVYITAKPEVLSASLRPGGADSQILEITNNSSEPILVALGAYDVAQEYARSVFENLTVKLRTPDILEIDPRRSARAVIVVRAPREGVSGGYYGYITAYAFSQDEEYLGEKTVELHAVVSGEHHYEAEVLSAMVAESDGLLFSAVVENKSDVHISPTGVAYLKDEAGEIIRVISLNLQEGVNHILPEQTGYLMAEGWEIEPGEYLAEIHVYNDGLEIGYAEEMVIVPHLQEEDH